MSKWQVREETSKVDDSRNVFLIVDSVEEMKGRYGKSEVARLIMTCREKSTDIYIDFGTNFMSSLNGGGKITTRVDKQPARSQSWEESNDHNALGLWTTASAVSFIKTLIGGNVLYARAVPHSESAVEAEFPITGLDEAIKPLRSTCKW